MILGEPRRDKLDKSISNDISFPIIQKGRETLEYELWSKIKNDLGIKVMDSTPRVTKIYNKIDI